MPSVSKERKYAGIMRQYVRIMRHCYKISHNKTYAPLELEEHKDESLEE